MDEASFDSNQEVNMGLTHLFEESWYGSRGSFLWLLKSPNLTPLDIFLRGRVNKIAYSSHKVDI